MNKLVFIFTSLISFGLFAEGSKVSEDTVIKQIRDISPEKLVDFASEMKQVQDLSSDYVDQKRAECLGEFSVVSINEKGEEVIEKKKLTRKERKNCLYMLINFRIKVTEEMYKVRKKHLIFLQKKQEENLENDKKMTLNELEKLASKYKR